MPPATGRGSAPPTPVSPRTIPAALLLIFGLAAVLSACAPDRPLVERLEHGDWRADSFQVGAVSGRRDGGEVLFSLVLAGHDGVRLRVEGTIVIDPQARLASGRWEESGGPARRSGPLSAKAVDFLGGQGGRPSLGGQFILGSGQDVVYRLNLPPTALEVNPSRP